MKRFSQFGRRRAERAKAFWSKDTPGDQSPEGAPSTDQPPNVNAGTFEVLSRSGVERKTQEVILEATSPNTAWDPALEVFVDLDGAQNGQSNEPFTGWLDTFQALVDPADQPPLQSIQQDPVSTQFSPFGAEQSVQGLDDMLFDTASSTHETSQRPDSFSPSLLDQTLDPAAKKCVQCQLAQYVNDEGRCMVCQHYFDLNVTWKPRFGESGQYSSWNSSSSSVGSIGSLDSAVSISSTGPKRGKRISGGYPCRHLGCGQVFDVPSDLRHHERKHKSKENRAHGCHCGERFLYPKDLLRHSNNVHKERLPVVRQAPKLEVRNAPVKKNDGAPLETSKRMKRKAHSPPSTPSRPSRDEVNTTYEPHQCDKEFEEGKPPLEIIDRADYLLGDESFRFANSPNQAPRGQTGSQQRRVWLRMIDHWITSSKGFRSVETSNAIAHLSRELDQLDVHD